MSLASVIRLEFAYPGVGILAGDSLQYLSIATAHGVIMVFFMIMPAVFGAFGNFLLPTQLGVHDVAFPRLNSAAFWFLPGGLIMLMQLVCVDRRYQRMNCFNIRELQGNLKRKFFTDLVNSNDHRDFLNQSILGMRFKNNNNLAVTPDMEAFYNFGTTVSPKTKSFSFTNDYNALSSYASTFTTQFSLTPNLTLVTTSLSVLSNLVSHLKSICELFISLTPYSVTTITSLPTNLSNSVACNLNHFGFSVTLQLLNLNKAEVSPITVPFNSENISTSNITEGITSSLSEVTNSYRFNRFSNPLISYDYKCGHYLCI
jgi:hypothetical protein